MYYKSKVVEWWYYFAEYYDVGSILWISIMLYSEVFWIIVKIVAMSMSQQDSL